MAKITKIHQNKQPVRRHYIAEWLEAKGMTPMDLLDALNHPDRPMEFSEIDKSQVYRWIGGQLPQPRTQARIAGVLGFEDDAGKLLQSPDADWMNEFFENRSREELERIKLMLQAAFPRSDKTSTGR